MYQAGIDLYRQLIFFRNRRKMKIVKNNPTIIYALTGLLFWFFIWIANIQYDDGGIRGLIFIAGEIFTLPFWLVQELIFTLNNGHTMVGQNIISIIFGLIICLVVDLSIRRLLKPRRRRRT